MEGAGTKICYFFFLKCILKKNRKNSFLFKPVLIFFTFKDIKKQVAELSNITSFLPLLSLLLLLFSCCLAPFSFFNTHLKKEKSVLASSITILLGWSWFKFRNLGLALVMALH